jgi:hypothetical protein
MSFGVGGNRCRFHSHNLHARRSTVLMCFSLGRESGGFRCGLRMVSASRGLAVVHGSRFDRSCAPSWMCGGVRQPSGMQQRRSASGPSTTGHMTSRICTSTCRSRLWAACGPWTGVGPTSSSGSLTHEQYEPTVRAWSTVCNWWFDRAGTVHTHELRHICMCTIDCTVQFRKVVACEYSTRACIRACVRVFWFVCVCRCVCVVCCGVCVCVCVCGCVCVCVCVSV